MKISVVLKIMAHDKLWIAYSQPMSFDRDLDKEDCVVMRMKQDDREYL